MTQSPNPADGDELIDDDPASPAITTGIAVEVISRVGSVAVIRGGSFVSGASDRPCDGARPFDGARPRDEARPCDEVWSCDRARSCDWVGTLRADVPAAAGLGPVLRDAFDALGRGSRKPDKLDFVAVADGPGSFTGLRIAVTTAKSIAYAASIPVVAVDSLAAIAASLGRLPGDGPPTIWVALQAYRGQVFSMKFDVGHFADWNAAARDESTGTRLLSAQQWRRELNDAADPILVTGDRRVFADVLDGDSGDQSGRCWVEPAVPYAVGVARLAIAQHASGGVSPAMAVSARYFRPSAAEEAHPKASGGAGDASVNRPR